MNESENFESLKALLSLKRHEQPPPGYFNDLPRKVWVRLERGEAAPVSFLDKYFSRKGMDPVVAYSFGLVVCATLVFGIGYSLKTEPDTALVQPHGNGSLELTFPTPALTADSRPLNFLPFQSNLASTNPLLNPPDSLFPINGLNLNVQPASYSGSTR